MSDAMASPISELIARTLRDVPDFPQPGVVFKDFTPLFADPEAFGALVRNISSRYAGHIDCVAGIEARGFILGAAVAHELSCGFVPIRKAGKLPGETVSASYALEYGTATVEVQRDAFRVGDATQRVLVLDDVLATGGTAAAACGLVEQAGGEVHCFEAVLELGFLNGRDRIAGFPVNSLLLAD